jgi:hypothetical protein
VQRHWLQGFTEGLEAKFKEQVQRSTSMAVMLTIHPIVRDAYTDLDPREEPLPPAGHDQ